MPPAPLSFRNFRLLTLGQGLGQIGAFFQIVAVSLLVLDANGSAFALGLTMGVQAIPMLVLSPWAGVIIDRVRIHRLLRVAAAVGAAQSLILGAIVANDSFNLVALAALSFVLGCVQTFDRPATQAFLQELVPRETIPAAVALSSSTQAVGRLGGPALAAILYSWLGAEWCFFVNAVGWLAVFAALSFFRTSEMYARPKQTPSRGQFVEGLAFVWRSPLHRTVLISNAVVGCLAFNFPLFYASLVKKAFEADSVYFGIAESLNAITAVAGGIIISRMRIELSLKLYAIACLALGISLTWSAASPTMFIFLAGMLYFGITVVFYQTAAQSLLQRATPPQLIGRVMSLYMLGLMGTTPIGGLLMGWIIDAVSARAAVGLGGASLLLAAAVIAFLPHNDPVEAVEPLAGS